MDPEMDERQKLRQQSYKQGTSKEENRSRRTKTTLSIRRQKKMQALKRRRHIPDLTPEEQEQVVSNTGFSVNANTGAHQVEQLPQLMDQLRYGDGQRQLEATTMFRKLLSIEKTPPIDLVIEAGAVPIFIAFLDEHDFPQLQFEAAWALTNIASGKTEHTKIVIENGAVQPLIGLLSSGNDDVREQAVWCIGNIAGDSVQCRDYVLHNKIMNPLLQNLTDAAKLSMLRTATWTLSNLCRGKPQPDWSMVSPALGTLARLIYSTDDEVLTDSLWALSYLSDGSDDRIQQIIDAGVCRRVVELLLHHSPSVQVPALRSVGNIVTGNDIQTQIVLNCSLLPCLYALLHSPKENIKKEACWTISNITAGNKMQIKAVIDQNLIPPIIKILSTSEYFKTRKEAAWAISNLTSGGSDDQIRYLVTRGAIKPLCDLLVCSDVRIILVALEGIQNILRVGAEDELHLGYNPYAGYVDEADGLNKIDLLQSHQNGEIFKMSADILEKYFAGQEDVADVAPNSNNNGQYDFANGINMPAGGFQFNQN